MTPSTTLYIVSNITSHAGVLIGYGVWRQTDIGGGSYIAQTFRTGPDALREMQDECDRLNANCKFDAARHGPQPRREHKRSFQLFKGVYIDPIGDSQWAARIGRSAHGPARDSLKDAYAARMLSA